MNKLTIRLAAAAMTAGTVLMAQTPAPREPLRVVEPLGETSETKMTLFELAVPAGGSVPLRTHKSAAFAYVIEGEIERLSPTNAPETLPPGTFFREAAGQPVQMLRNSGKEAAKVLILQNSASLPTGVKPLLEYTLTDLRDLEVSFITGVTNPGSPGPRPHIHPGAAFAYIAKGEVLSQVEPDAPEKYRAGEVFLEMPGRVHQSYVNLSKTEPVELLLFQVYKKGQTSRPPPAK
jgi:quercetin dioxygenase-like cupin family protein